MWLAKGDRNTKFFHNTTKMRRVVNRITKIKNSKGDTLEKPKEISNKIVSYFSNIYIKKE